MKCSLLVLFCLSFSIVTAATVWEDNLKIRNSVAIEWNRVSAETSDAGMLYVWSDSHASDRDLYAQRVSPQGNAVWTSPRVVDNKTGIQKKPIMIKTSDSNFIVAWIDTHHNPSGEIYIQKITETCQTLWPEGGIRVTSNNYREFDLRLNTDNFGGLIITWSLESDSSIDTYAQSFSSDGNRRWQENGINLTTIPYYSITSIVPDGSNGIIIAYSSDYDSASRVYLNRFNMDGTVAWPTPICIGNGIDMNRSGLLVKGGEAIYLLWTHYDGYISSQFMHKFSVSGQPLWAEPIHIVGSELYYDNPQEMVYSLADDSIIMSIIRSGTPSSLILQKFNSSGQMLWGTGVLVDSNPSYYYSPSSVLIVSANGSCFVAWTHYADTAEYPNIYAQRFDSSGNSLWSNGGVSLCSNVGNPFMPSIKLVDDRLWAAWSDHRGSEKSIYYQILSPAGSPILELNGRHLFGGINSMFTEGKLTLSRSSDMITLWDDDRFNENKSQIYLQSINPDGSLDFPPNGIPITQYTNAPQYISTALVLPNDQTVVVWMDGRYGQYELFAQLLSPSGAHLWGETGICLTSFQSGWNANTRICEENGSIYIGWTHYSSYNNGSIGSIWMQKIAGGMIQWAEGGVCVINDPAPCDNRLYELKGRYLVYSKRLLSALSMTDLYALRINENDGSPSTGWGTVGMPVANSSGLTINSRNPHGLHLVTQGALVLYTENTVEHNDCVKGQLFSPEGQPVLGASGALVMENPDGFYAVDCDFGTEDFALLWQESNESSTYTKMQRFSFDLVPLGAPLLIATHSGFTYYAGLVRFSNNAFSVVWCENSYIPEIDDTATIEYRYITPAGELIGSEPGYSIATNHTALYNLQSTVLGNRALITWSDGSSFWSYKDEPVEHSNLWAQMITNETTGIADPGAVPPIAFTLFPNFPNPFNPSTTIQFQLKNPARVELSIFNLKGQLTKTLVKEALAIGTYSAVWDGIDSFGNKAASGVYLYRLSVGTDSQIRKMVLVK